MFGLTMTIRAAADRVTAKVVKHRKHRQPVECTHALTAHSFGLWDRGTGAEVARLQAGVVGMIRGEFMVELPDIAARAFIDGLEDAMRQAGRIAASRTMADLGLTIAIEATADRVTAQVCSQTDHPNAAELTHVLGAVPYGGWSKGKATRVAQFQSDVGRLIGDGGAGAFIDELEDAMRQAGRITRAGLVREDAW